MQSADHDPGISDRYFRRRGVSRQRHPAPNDWVQPSLTQHCGLEIRGSGVTTMSIPVDRVTLNLEGVAHAPAGSHVTATYTVPGTGKTGTAVGQFDPVKGNATFDFTVASPPAGKQLNISYQASWADGTSYSNTLVAPLLHCTQDNTNDADRTRDDRFATAQLFQRCQTVVRRIDGVPVFVRENIVTVWVQTYDPDSGPNWFAGQPVWLDYWIPGHKGYTSAATGTFDSDGKATLTFKLTSPKAGSEINVLASARETYGRTYPAYNWTTNSC